MAKRSSGKAERIAQRHFSHVEVFDPQQGCYSPLAWVLRSCMWLFTARGFQLYAYLAMRSGPSFVSWQTDKEIAFDLGIKAKGLPKYMQELKELGLVAFAEDRGLRYIRLVDPLHAITQLVRGGRFNPDRLQALNDDLEQMKLPIIEESLPKNVTKLQPRKTKLSAK